jgi:hypothetical protein
MPASTPALLTLTPETVSHEHLCCAIMGGKLVEGVDRKREFLAQGFRRGLVFRKLDVHGKVFIEYAPAEAAWRPVVAPGYLVIHCLWVSGRFKGLQWGGRLLRSCLEDAGDASGVVAVSGRRPYLTDTRFYLHQGFQVVDRTDTGFDLVCLKNRPSAPDPRFGRNARRGVVSRDRGVHFEYAYQCPFVPTCLRDMARVAGEFGLPVTTKELSSAAAAQRAASPFGTFGAFLHGKLVTHELMSPAKFRGLLRERLAPGT